MLLFGLILHSSIVNHFFSTSILCFSISSLSCSTFSLSLSTDNLLCSIFISCTSSCAAFCFRQLVEGLLAAWFTRNVSLDRSLFCEGRILSGQLLQPASENKDKRKHKDWC